MPILCSRLRAVGLRGRVAEERSLLSPANIQARRAFAEDALNQYPDEFWRDVIFSDEKTFDTSSHGRQIVYR
jgi:hypothetical protein